MVTGLPSLKGLKILITGGLGFIGSNLADKCLELGAEVTIYDYLDPNSGGNTYNVSHIKDRVEIVLGNILNFEDICQHIKGKDVIFNCAASSSHSFSMREPWADLDVNGRGVINLLEAARQFTPKIKFIHIGTTTQMGRLQYTPADECHPEFPTDIYSANKSVSEKYVLIYNRAYKIPATVVRLPNVFGPRACINSSDFTFVNYFIGLALQDKEVTVYGKGAQLRNLIYIDDCVSALIMASQSKNVNGEVLFAAGDEHYKLLEIAAIIIKHIGFGKIKSIDWPTERKSIEVGDAIISNEKIKRMLGWKTENNIEVGLVKTKNYYENCLEHYLR